HAFQNLGGAVSIGAEIHHDSHHGPAQVMLTAALLSISIGLLNLFPIPILDGGHLLMMLVEFIRRRKMSSTEVEAFQSIGLAIIAVLVLVVMVHDIQRLRG
ncbi:MAG: site-2 protease family protein, partial [Armatimonadetes bacterium]|nr:site-2 protease family protein [Armatimonadota bacterium]